jgi:hypothetical protein
MGGLGSGTWYRFNKKALTDHYRAIEVQQVYNAGARHMGIPFLWTWGALQGAENPVTIELSPNRKQLTVSYGWYQNGHIEQIQYCILFTYTPCNYGGYRPWFLCPHCGRRVGKLYLGGKYFLCRHCYNLAYRSQISHCCRSLSAKIRPGVLQENLVCR